MNTDPIVFSTWRSRLNIKNQIHNYKRCTGDELFHFCGVLFTRTDQ